MSAAQTADNLARIRERIAAAALRSGRRAGDVALVAVTKHFGRPELEGLYQAGCRDFGESRPQALWERAEVCQGWDVRWHLVGHLQRNKVRRTVPLVHLVHSADSRRLIEAIDQAAAELGRRVPLLLEVNVSGEAAKHGFAPQEVEPLLPELAVLRHVEVRGLMAMAGLGSDPEQARRQFASLRRLRDRLQPGCPQGVWLSDLSMGMSGDFEAAIEEGATLVRIGSALVEDDSA